MEKGFLKSLITRPARISVTAALVLATTGMGCGTEIKTLARASKFSTGASGIPPEVTSLAILDASPTSHRPLALDWGLEVGSHSQYCILENTSNSNVCIWKTGSLPTTYLDSAADGPLVLTAYVKNSFGTSAAIISNSVTIDHTAPALASANVTNSNPTSTATLGLNYGAVTGGTYSDYCVQTNSSSVAACTWNAGPLPASVVATGGDGAKVLTFWLRDAAGNVSMPVDTASVTVDTGVPTLAISTPAAGSYVNAANVASFAVTGTCSENTQNVVITGDAAATVVCSAGAWSANLDFTGASAGNVTIDVNHSDAAGNAATQASRIFVKDATLPTLASVAVTNADPTNSTTYNLTYGAQSGSYTHYCILENDTTVGNCTYTAGALPATFAVDATNEAKVLSVWIRDAAGNVSVRRDSNSVTLDTVAPVVASLTVDNGSPTDTNPFYLSWGTITGSYSHYCILENDANSNNCTFVAGTVPASFTVTEVDQAKTLYAWVRDAAGNISAAVNSGAITYNGVLKISPTSTTISESRGGTNIYGGRYDMGWITLSTGDLFAAGGRANNNGITDALYYRNTSYRWEGVAPMHTARYRPRLVERANGQILVIGGCTNGTNSGTNSVEVFTPSTGRWARLANMATARCRHTATLLADGRVLVAGGQNGATYHSSTEIYNPLTNRWVAGPTLSVARSEHEAGRFDNGNVMIAGGWDGTTTVASSEIYSASAGTLSAGANMNVARRDFGMIHSPAATDPFAETFIALGGFDGTNHLTSVEAHSVGIWMGKANMPTARRGNSYVATGNGNVLAVGGWSAAAASTAAVHSYNRVTDGWTAESSLPAAVRLHAVGRVGNGRVLTFGGIDGTYSAGSPRARVYDPVGDSWSWGYDLIRRMVNITSILLDDDRVLSCGGYDQDAEGMQDECWVYDPGKHASKSVGKLREAADGIRMIKLDNGIIAIAGGYTNAGRSNKLDLFDPTNDSWAVGANMPYYLGNTIVAPIPGNKFVVGGGEGGVAFNTASYTNLSWIYDYGTNAWTATGNLPSGTYRTCFTTTPSGRIFAAGGYNGTTWSNQLLEYVVGTGTWVSRAVMAETSGRAWCSLKAYESGGNEYLVVAGGVRELWATILSSVERYDVTNNSWTSLNNMPGGTSLHYAHVNAAANRMWVFGGYGGSQTAVYEMNLSAGTWTTATSLSASRYNAFTGSVSLADGRVYVVHGSETNPAEIYHFTTPRTFTATGGDKNYGFSVSAGVGTMHDQARTYIGPYPLPGGSSTVRVTDGLGATANATATH